MSSDQDHVPTHAWIRGAAISALGVLVGAIAFVLFCYTLGLNFTDEGWANHPNQPWQVNRVHLIGSFVGFAVGILLFWMGFVQTTRSSS